MTDLLRSPLHAAADLGKPLPESEHAVSVCLPLWEHNVGYEEADPAVTERMRSGYPRFFLQPQLVRLFREYESRFAAPGERCFAFPSRRVAERCVDFVRRETGLAGRVIEDHSTGLYAVCLPEKALPAAKSYWQHTGEIVSSRLANHALRSGKAAFSDSASKQTLRERLAGLTGCRTHDVFLFPSGMAAIFCAYRAFQKLRPGSKSVQFGFPYVDTLKVQQRFGRGVHLFPRGDDAECSQLQRLLDVEPVMGLFCEFPSNPLLTCPDLARLRELADRHRFPLAVDDTLGAFLNVDCLPAADVLTTSLTKFFSGGGDVMGGALMLNREGPLYDKLRALIDEEYEDLLFDVDADVLEQNSRNVAERVRRINATTETLCDLLRHHPTVERIDYPKYSTAEQYRRFQRAGGGCGGLFSIQLRDASRAAPRFFDALGVSKGPNLGTNFTLACPYTILAHYRELDFAESCGVSRYLIRVSVGLEDADCLADRFRRAFDGLSG